MRSHNLKFSARPRRSRRLGGECLQTDIHRRVAEVAEDAQRKTEIGTLLPAIRGALVLALHPLADRTPAKKAARHLIGQPCLSETGGDDRIRTCEGLLTLNGLANRRLQPLGHISASDCSEVSF
jgi:hypothetical protein